MSCRIENKGTFFFFKLGKKKTLKVQKPRVSFSNTNSEAGRAASLAFLLVRERTELVSGGGEEERLFYE